MIENPWPPYLGVLYGVTFIPYSMNCYFCLWADYYDTTEPWTLWLNYTKESIEQDGMPYDVFLEHLSILEEHGLLEYKVINGSVAVLLEECIEDNHFDILDEIQNQ